MRPGNILGSPQSMQSHGGLTMYTTNLDTSLARVMSPSDGLTCSRCSSGVWCLGNIKRRGVQFNVCLAGHRQGTQHTWRQCQDIKWPAHATFVSTATTMNDDLHLFGNQDTNSHVAKLPRSKESCRYSYFPRQQHGA
jgi:hypothetical protein